MGISVIYKADIDPHESWIYNREEKVLYKCNPGRGESYVSNKHDKIVSLLRREEDRLNEGAASMAELIQIVLEDRDDA